MIRKINQTKLRVSMNKVRTLRKGNVKLYLKLGIPRKIRLSKEYPYKNMISLNIRGTKCILCGHLLGDKVCSTTTKCYEICQVPLCSVNSAKSSNTNESCKYRWYYIYDLKTLSILAKRSLTKNVTGSILEVASRLLRLNGRNSDSDRFIRKHRR